MFGILERKNDAPTDDNRMANRRSVRESIAERQAALDRAKALRQRVAELDRELDRAADLHREATEESQIELRELEERYVVAVADRKPVPPEIESERRDLIERIHVANVQLDEVVQRIKRAKLPLEKEARQLMEKTSDIQVLQNRLAGEFGNPELKLEQHCIKQSVKWSGNRLTAATAQASQWEAVVKKLQGHASEMTMNSWGNRVNKQLDAADTEQLRIMQNRAARWDAEVNAAGRALEDAQAEANRIFRALIDE